MGIYHRDYMRPGFQGDSQQGGSRSWSIVTLLIVINVAVYILNDFSDNKLLEFGSLSWGELMSGRVWTLFTYMFLHGSIFHIAANMLVLFFAGRNVLTMLGRKHFLIIYFGGGLVGAAAQMAFGLLIGEDNYLIGASAGVFATVIAMAVLIPEQKVYLLLFFVIPIRMKMKILAIVFVVGDVVMLIGELSDWWQMGIGNLAHLGGAFFGWLYIKRGLSGAGRGRSSPDQADRWMSRFGGDQVVDAEITGSSERKKSWFKSSKKKPYVSDNVDKILDKISKDGMQSLTEDERKILEKSSEKLGRMTNRLDRDN